MALVSDNELLNAMSWAMRETRIALEPSGAASLAVALREARAGDAGTFAVLLSGGNVDPTVLASALARAPGL
jgi:threonine dehydratase